MSSYEHNIDVIRTEYAKGRGAVKRAEALTGMSSAAIRKAAQRHGIAQPSRAGFMHVVVREYADGGACAQRAALKLGVTKAVVWKFAAANGVRRARAIP